MRALVCREFGALERLCLEQWPEPALADDKARIAVTAAGVSFANTVVLDGRHQNTPELPFIPGTELAGVVVDKGACTLCLSCVSLCPSGALGDNPDKPQLRFREDACLQCGICATICPEDAISLVPQLNLTDAALRQEILNEEEPFACIECGALFGSKSAIDKITEKLTGHPMFSDPGKLAMIQMCDDCRVNAQMHSQNNPFASAERPRPRTTDDYLSDRKDH